MYGRLGKKKRLTQRLITEKYVRRSFLVLKFRSLWYPKNEISFIARINQKVLVVNRQCVHTMSTVILPDKLVNLFTAETCWPIEIWSQHTL